MHVERILIKIEEGDEPREVNELALALRKLLPIGAAPQIDVQYPSGRVLKF